MTSISSGSASFGQRLDISALSSRLFKKADANEDKKLSIDEFISAGKKVPGGKKGVDETRAKELFAKMDADGDGSLTTTEVDQFTQKLIDQMQSAMTQLQEALGGQQKKQGDRPMGPPPPPPPMSEMFGKIDSDSSGGISKTEFTEFGKSIGKTSEQDSKRGEELFAKIDANGDGSLSKDEVTAFDAAKEEKRQARNESQQLQASMLLEALNAYGRKGRTAQTTSNQGTTSAS